jgi:phosphate transport system permease protein
VKSSHTTARIIKNKIFLSVVIVLSFLSISPMLFILFYIVKNGISSINWQFLTELPRPAGEAGGGVFNAIVGTFILIIVSSVLSVPIGMTAGIYLSEKRQGKLAQVVKLCVEVLQGTPSIVIGIIAYTWIVLPLKTFSAFSGGVALGMMMIPVIIKSTEETLKLIPYHLKEASLALGVPYHRTILRVILPAGISGILTGILLGIARITGETAPLLFTSFGNPFLNTNLFKPTESLPHVIFNYATSPYPQLHNFAWGAAFILVVLVLTFNLTARGVARKWKVQL